MCSKIKRFESEQEMKNFVKKHKIYLKCTQVLENIEFKKKSVENENIKITKPILKKFNDLKKEDINFDYHTHTNQTDGKSSPKEMINNTIEKKLCGIAFTEHVTKSSDWYKIFAKKINKIKKDNSKKLNIYLGIEAKAIDFEGNIDATQNMIDMADIVVGVVHRYPIIDNDKAVELISMDDISKMNPEKAADIEFKLMMGLLDNKDIDVLGHPFGVYSKFFDDLPINKLRKILEKAKEKDIAIEINMKYILDKETFFRLLEDVNPKVSIGSDAHHKNEIGKYLEHIKDNIKNRRLK